MAGSRGKVLGDAWARQCGRQHSQTLWKVVVRVFWWDLAEAGARRGEWLLYATVGWVEVRHRDCWVRPAIVCPLLRHK